MASLLSFAILRWVRLRLNAIRLVQWFRSAAGHAIGDQLGLTMWTKKQKGIIPAGCALIEDLLIRWKLLVLVEMLLTNVSRKT